MAAQITLDANTEAKVKSAIPTSSNSKTYYAAHAKIYYAYAGTKKWFYRGIEGALAAVFNIPRNALYFKMVDLDGARGVIWDYESHDGVVLEQDKNVPFFLSFEGNVDGQKCTIGFVFLDDSEATTFYNRVKHNNDTKSAIPTKPKRSSWMKSISKGGNIDKSMISHPKEGAFVHVAHMGYDADSGFTSMGVDPSWTAVLKSLHGYLGKQVVASDVDFIKDFIRNYSERQKNQPVVTNRGKTPPPPPPPPSGITRSRTLPSSRVPARGPSRAAASHRPISPVIEDEQSPPLPPLPPPPSRRPTPPTRVPPPPPVRSPPPPPRRTTPLTHVPPLPPIRSPPPQIGRFPLRRETEANQTFVGIHDSRPRYPESPPSPVILSPSISRNTSSSQTIVPSRSISSPNGTGTLIRRQESHRSQRPSPTYEAFDEDDTDAESPTHNANQTQTVQLPSSHARKKPVTSQTVVPSRSISSTNGTGTSTLIRRQESHRSQRPSPTYEVFDEDDTDAESLTHGANQTQAVQRSPKRSEHSAPPWILASRTPHAPKKPVDMEFMEQMADIRRQTNDSDASSTSSAPRVSLIVPRVSVSSSAFSQSLSVSSAPRVVEFPPTPVFKDEVPETVMRKVRSPPF